MRLVDGGEDDGQDDDGKESEKDEEGKGEIRKKEETEKDDDGEVGHCKEEAMCWKGGIRKLILCRAGGLNADKMLR